MPRRVFSFDPPERFVAGTVGEPGQRTFFLQAREGANVVSVALEKVQVRVLAERLAALLDEVRRRGADVPATASKADTDVAPLETPIAEDFRAGELRLAWDGEDQRIVIEALAGEPDTDESDETSGIADDEDDERDVLRVRMTPALARGFVERALRVVAAGRPPCPLCGQPLDAEGHICPRLNGHRTA